MDDILSIVKVNSDARRFFLFRGRSILSFFLVSGYAIRSTAEVRLHQVSFVLALGCNLPPVSAPMGTVWEVMETGRGFSCLTLVSPCYGYFRNADSPVSADHGTLQEMTIATKAKYDSKCHGVCVPCGRVETRDHVNLNPDLLCLFQ